MPNCEEHKDCDLICSWCGYYCVNEAHKWRWVHRKQYTRTVPSRMQTEDMPDDLDEYYNERSEASL